MCENDPWAAFINRDQSIRNMQILAEAARHLSEPKDEDG